MGQQPARRRKAGHKEVEKHLAAAEAQGFTVRELKSGHFAVYAPDGTWVTNFPGSPGNDARRSILNSVSPLKRAGYQPRR